MRLPFITERQRGGYNAKRKLGRVTQGGLLKEAAFGSAFQKGKGSREAAWVGVLADKVREISHRAPQVHPAMKLSHQLSG